MMCVAKELLITDFIEVVVDRVQVTLQYI
jgi:hypothetical protein